MYTKFMWMHVPVILLESVQQESYKYLYAKYFEGEKY